MILVMVRRLAALLVSLALVGGGLVAAHTVAYRLVHGSAAHEHPHEYLGSAPVVLALLFGFSLAALAVALRESEAHLRAPAWLFALAPPLAFAVQEHVERALQGEPTARTALEPTFALGLALQLPFALLAYLAARVLFTALAMVVRRFAVRGTRRGPAKLAHPVFHLLLPRPAALARGFSSRGPPALSV
jgi:hypothetical protein